MLLQATPLLEVFGDVVVGHLLAEQAQIALDLREENGARTPTAEQLEDEETAYLWGKVLRAQSMRTAAMTADPAPRPGAALNSTTARRRGSPLARL